jgi:hypothetical protein
MRQSQIPCALITSTLPRTGAQWCASLGSSFSGGRSFTTTLEIEFCRDSPLSCPQQRSQIACEFILTYRYLFLRDECQRLIIRLEDLQLIIGKLEGLCI